MQLAKSKSQLLRAGWNRGRSLKRNYHVKIVLEIECSRMDMESRCRALELVLHCLTAPLSTVV